MAKIASTVMIISQKASFRMQIEMRMTPKTIKTTPDMQTGTAQMEARSPFAKTIPAFSDLLHSRKKEKEEKAKKKEGRSCCEQNPVIPSSSPPVQLVPRRSIPCWGGGRIPERKLISKHQRREASTGPHEGRLPE